MQKNCQNLIGTYVTEPFSHMNYSVIQNCHFYVGKNRYYDIETYINRHIYDKILYIHLKVFRQYCCNSTIFCFITSPM